MIIPYTTGLSSGIFSIVFLLEIGLEFIPQITIPATGVTLPRGIITVVTFLMLLGVLLKRVYEVNNFSGKTLLKDSRTSYDRLDLLNSSKYYGKYFSANKPKSVMQLTYAGEKQAIEMLKSYLEKGICQL